MDVRELKLEHGLAGRRILLSVGRLAPRKGFDTVIEALGEIVSAHPDTLYVMVVMVQTETVFVHWSSIMAFKTTFT